MKSILSLLFASVIFLGCSENDPDKIENTSFPMHVGDYWEYKPINPSVYSYDVRNEIKATEIIDGKEYFLMVRTYTSSQHTSVDSIFYRYQDNGFVFSVDKYNGFKELNPFRLAAIEGQSWPYPSDWGDRRAKLTQVGPAELNGSVLDDCKTYFFDTEIMADDELYHILAPGLGIVESGGAWGFHVKLKKANINGQEYNF